MINADSIPAAVALFGKVLLFWFVRWPTIGRTETVVFFVLLIAFSLQNLVELSTYYYTSPPEGIFWFPLGYAYMAVSLVVVAFMMHLAMCLSPVPRSAAKPITTANYSLLILLLILLLTTPYLIVGFKKLEWTYTRVPGEYYGLITAFFLSNMLLTLIILIHSIIQSRSAEQRRQAAMMLLGMAPVILFASYVLIRQSVKPGSTGVPFYLPLATTFFLIVAAIGIYRQRLFSISMPYIFDRHRGARRYLQSWVNDIFSTAAPEQLMQKLASAAQVTVAVADARRIIASSNSAATITRIPPDALLAVNKTIVSAEVRRTSSQATLMNDYGIGAVIPYGSNTERRWLIFAKPNSGEPLNFAQIEDLIQAINTARLDDMALRQNSMAKMAQQIDKMETANRQLADELEASEVEFMQRIQTLQAQNKINAVDAKRLLEIMDRKKLSETAKDKSERD